MIHMSSDVGAETNLYSAIFEMQVDRQRRAQFLKLTVHQQRAQDEGTTYVMKAWIHAGPSVQKAVDVHVSLKSVPGMIQTTMEWKANIWMVKVLTGPTGGPQLDLPDWRPREWGQLGRLGWASHPPRLRWPRGSATSGRCWTRISPSLARSRS